MAAIEYFTEPGDHLSILIILIDVVIVIEYLTEPGDQLPPHYQTLLLLLLLLLTHKKTTQASSANNKKNAIIKKNHPGITEDEWLSEKQQVKTLKTFHLEKFKNTSRRKCPLPTMKI